MNVLLFYLEGGVLLFFSALVCLAAGRFLSWQSQIRLSRFCCSLSAVFLILSIFVPQRSLFRPTVQVWSSAPRVKDSYNLLATTKNPSQELTGVKVGHQTEKILLALGAGLVTISLLRFFWSLWSLNLFLHRQPRRLTLGRLAVVECDEGSPFSAVGILKTFIAFPPTLSYNHAARRLAYLHEIEHLRNRDTSWVFIQEALKAFYFWNPLVHLWFSTLNQIQEFACDERLVGRKHVSPQVYGRCLLEAAESARGGGFRPVVAMAAHSSGSQLKRRIEMILKKERNPKDIFRPAYFFAGSLCLLAVTAWAARSSVQSGSLSMEQAQEFAAVASRTSAIPIAMNPMVLAELNRFVGTPEGRKWLKESLGRLPPYRKMIEDHISDVSAPAELLAIPLAESGMDSTQDNGVGAGLWGFTVETGKQFGLTINETVDERTDNPEKATVKALVYLSQLHGMFKGDWRMAIKAYNLGEFELNEQIKNFHTEDPWALEKIAQTKERYLSTVMALMIVLKSPDLML